MMIGNIRYYFIIIGIIFINTLPAKAVYLNPADFMPGDLISIENGEFGDYNDGFSYICFNDDQHCLMSESIESWSNDSIKFYAPSPLGLPNQGIIYVYVDFLEVADIPYRYFPVIGRIDNSDRSLQSNQTLIAAKPNETIYIEGYAFGETGKVYFAGSTGERTVNVDSWSDRLIKVVVPEYKQAHEIIVQSSNGLRAYYKITVQEDVTLDDYSYFQEYIYSTGINRMWNLLETRETIVVAVIDNGIFYSHPDLTGKMWFNSQEIDNNNIDDDQNGYVDDLYGWNFVENSTDIEIRGSHGTTVAGIIGAIRDNQEGIAGIADKVKIMPLVACTTVDCPGASVIEAIYYAVDNGARIINISLGSTDINSFNEAYTKPIKYAWERGVVVIVAAGNGDSDDKGVDTSKHLLSIICNEDIPEMIIGVGASTLDNKQRASWSNYGDCVDIYAPGEGVLSTSAGDLYYGQQDGTSFSAPIVAGVAAMVLSAYPQMSNLRLWEYLTTSSNNQMLNAEKLINNIKLRYNPDFDTGNQWLELQNRDDLVVVDHEQTKEPVFDNKQADLKQSFSDVSPRHRNAEAIAYMQQEGIINGYHDGKFLPNSNVNRAELLKILIEANPNDFNASKYDQNCFLDVQMGQWFTPYVCYAQEKGWVAGYRDGTFQPGRIVSKAEAVKIVLIAYNFQVNQKAQVTPFTDVLLEDWFAPYLEVANNLNLLEISNGYFFPHSGMSRAGISQIIFNAIFK